MAAAAAEATGLPCAGGGPVALGILRGHAEAVTAVRFVGYGGGGGGGEDDDIRQGADGQCLLSGAADGTLCLWSLHTRRVRCEAPRVHGRKGVLSVDRVHWSSALPLSASLTAEGEQESETEQKESGGRPTSPRETKESTDNTGADRHDDRSHPEESGVDTLVSDTAPGSDSAAAADDGHSDEDEAAPAEAGTRAGAMMISNGRDGVLCLWDLSRFSSSPSSSSHLPSASSSSSSASQSCPARSVTTAPIVTPLCSWNTGSFHFCNACGPRWGAMSAFRHSMCSSTEDIECVALWDTRASEPCAMLNAGTAQSGASTGMCMHIVLLAEMEQFGKTAGSYVVAGYENGEVVVFDLRTNTAAFRHRVSHRHPVTKLDVDRAASRAIIGTAGTEIDFVRLSLSRGKMKTLGSLELSAPGTGDIRIRDDQALAAVGGWDGTARLVTMRDPREIARVTVHHGTVNAVDFAPTRGADASSANEAASSALLTNLPRIDAPLLPRTFPGILATGSKDTRVGLWTCPHVPVPCHEDPSR